jgi:hypothetical protein
LADESAHRPALLLYGDDFRRHAAGVGTIYAIDAAGIRHRRLHANLKSDVTAG